MPTALLRYPTTADPHHHNRNLAILNWILDRYPVKLDFNTDGDERCCYFLRQALVAKDYRTIFSLVYGGLVNHRWLREIGTTLQVLEQPDLHSMFRFFQYLQDHLMCEIRPIGSDQFDCVSTLTFLKYMEGEVLALLSEDEHGVGRDTKPGLLPRRLWEARTKEYYHEWFSCDHDSNGAWRTFANFVDADRPVAWRCRKVTEQLMEPQYTRQVMRNT